MATLASDEIAGPLLSGVDSLTQAMVGLSNAGLTHRGDVPGPRRTGGRDVGPAHAQGKSGNDALRLMAPSLQRLWELQQKWGWAVDETRKRSSTRRRNRDSSATT